MTSEPGVQHTVDKLMFNPTGTLLDVTANGMVDSVCDVSSGEVVMTLTNTQRAQFSADGALLIGGNAKHLIVWNTKDWSKLRDLPNGPDYGTRIAAFPEKDFVVVGGPKVARPLRLRTGKNSRKWARGTRISRLSMRAGHSSLPIPAMVLPWGIRLEENTAPRRTREITPWHSVVMVVGWRQG
jgi:hypothetical protein